jgi:hypothetical protein
MTPAFARVRRVLMVAIVIADHRSLC